MDRWFRLPIRTKLGIISSALLVLAGLAIWVAIRDPFHNIPIRGIVKLAPILFLLWLAWKDLQNIPLWVWFVIPPVMILCALKPFLWFVVIPLGIVALFVMPKKKSRR